MLEEFVRYLEDEVCGNASIGRSDQGTVIVSMISNSSFLLSNTLIRSLESNGLAGRFSEVVTDIFDSRDILRFKNSLVCSNRLLPGIQECEEAMSVASGNKCEDRKKGTDALRSFTGRCFRNVDELKSFFSGGNTIRTTDLYASGKSQESTKWLRFLTSKDIDLKHDRSVFFHSSNLAGLNPDSDGLVLVTKACRISKISITSNIVRVEMHDKFRYERNCVMFTIIKDFGGHAKPNVCEKEALRFFMVRLLKEIVYPILRIILIYRSTMEQICFVSAMDYRKHIHIKFPKRLSNLPEDQTTRKTIRFLPVQRLSSIWIPVSSQAQGSYHPSVSICPTAKVPASQEKESSHVPLWTTRRR